MQEPKPETDPRQTKMFDDKDYLAKQAEDARRIFEAAKEELAKQGRPVPPAERLQAEGVEPPLGVLIPGMLEAAYNEAPGMRSSEIKTFLRSPAHWWHQKHVAERKETDALRQGQLVHMAILEPDRYLKAVKVRPTTDRRTKAGREAFEAFTAELADGDVACSQAEHDMALGILHAANAHEKLKKLLATGKREHSLFWHDASHDLLCKARYDFVAERTGIIVDIKTTTDARPDSFARDALKYGYGLSAAHYLEGANQTGVADPDRFAIVAVEKEAPYGIMLYEVSPDEITRAHKWRHKALAEYNLCCRENRWPCYDDSRFHMLEFPKYAPQAIDFDDGKA